MNGFNVTPNASVGVLVLVLVLEYNSSTREYSARTRLKVLEN